MNIGNTFRPKGLAQLWLGLALSLCGGTQDAFAQLGTPEGAGKKGILIDGGTPGGTPLTLFETHNLPGGFLSAGIGMRNRGSGGIRITVPSNSQIVAAYLYWAILNPIELPNFKNGTFNGTSIQGTLIGTDIDPCWEAGSTWGYRADVTDLFRNGCNSLQGFASGATDGHDAWDPPPVLPLIEGASLVVIFRNSSMPNRRIQIYEGVSTTAGGPEIDTAISGFTASTPVGSASITYVVADGQNASGKYDSFTGCAGTLTRNDELNGLDPNTDTACMQLPPHSLNNLWDTQTVDVTSKVGSGCRSASAAINGIGDCLVWIAALFATTEDSCGIYADSNRNGMIEKVEDERGKDKWTKTRGGLFFVNSNDDKGDKKADGLEFDRNEMPANEDLTINGNNDRLDITPFIIGPIPNLAAKKVYLQMPLNQVKAIHVFPKIEADERSIWGGPTETVMKKQIDPAFLSATDDKTFGFEGLMFRYDNAGHTMNFGGLVDLTLIVEDATTNNELCRDKVQLKVAPYIMLPNTQDSIDLYARNSGGVNAAFRTALGMSGQLTTYTTDTQWAQDPLEIGYSETPLTWSHLSAYTLHQGDLPGGDVQWMRDFLINHRRGIYRNPRSPAADSGDFGGNIELLPPTTRNKLGRICIGETISANKKKFFESQEVQEPFTLDTRWLAVGHVDEMLGFYKVGPHQVILASPKRAYALLGSPFAGAADGPEGWAGIDGEPPPDDAVFFASGATRSGTATGAQSHRLLDDTHDFTAENWKYVRIYVGPGAGQVAHVVARGVGYLEIDQVWGPYDIVNPTGAADTNCAGGTCTLGYNPSTTDGWIQLPSFGSGYVAVEDAMFWSSISMGALESSAGAAPLALPAVVTVKEVKDNGTLKALNVKAQAQIDDAKTRITAAMRGDPITFLEVPVIYTGAWDAATMTIVPRTGISWTPGLANFQMAGGRVFFPKQFGPKKDGNDIFEKDVTTTLGFAPIFADDWDHYHRRMGEVHCGSNVVRERFSFKWWENQP